MFFPLAQSGAGNALSLKVQIIFIRQILGKPQILPGCRVGILAVGYLQLNIILELILDDWVSAVHVQVFRVLCAGAACLLALVLGLAVLAVLGLALLAAFLLFPVAAIYPPELPESFPQAASIMADANNSEKPFIHFFLILLLLVSWC